MKSRKPLVTLLTSGASLFTAVSFAQDAQLPYTDMVQQAPSPMPQQTGSMHTQIPQGQLTAHPTMPPPPPAGRAPSFAQLSDGKKSISEDHAKSCPLLADDFINTDHNCAHRISKRAYHNWAAH